MQIPSSYDNDNSTSMSTLAVNLFFLLLFLWLVRISLFYGGAFCVDLKIPFSSSHRGSMYGRLKQCHYSYILIDIFLGREFAGGYFLLHVCRLLYFHT